MGSISLESMDKDAKIVLDFRNIGVVGISSDDNVKIYRMLIRKLSGLCKFDMLYTNAVNDKVLDYLSIGSGCWYATYKPSDYVNYLRTNSFDVNTFHTVHALDHQCVVDYRSVGRHLLNRLAECRNSEHERFIVTSIICEDTPVEWFRNNCDVLITAGVSEENAVNLFDDITASKYNLGVDKIYVKTENGHVILPL